MDPRVSPRRMAGFVLFFSIIVCAVAPLNAQAVKPVCQAMSRGGPSMCLQAVDSTPLHGRIPVIHIHGWDRRRPGPPGPEIWNNWFFYSGLVPWVGEKFKFYELNYWSNIVSVQDTGGQMMSLVDQMDATDQDFARQQLIIIAHSMGGLVARSFMQEYRLQGGRGMRGGDRVNRLITLATPHHGTPIANGPARDALAGPWLTPVLNVFENTLFAEVPWSVHDRSDLHADRYLASEEWIRLDYGRFPQDNNPWLDQLNDQNPYWGKISSYGGGVTDAEKRCVGLDNLASLSESDFLDCSALVLKGMFSTVNLWNDGIVPDESATLWGCNACLRQAFPSFSGYDHSQMAAGHSPYDSNLFGAILSDLSAIVYQNDSRFNSSVGLGDPASEPFHDLREWQDPGRNPIHGSYRTPSPEHLSSVDLFVPKAGVSYLLTYKRLDGGCDQGTYYPYIGSGDGDSPLDLFLDKGADLRCSTSQGASTYQWKIPSWMVKQRQLRVSFLDGSQNGTGAKPIFYVRLDPS